MALPPGAIPQNAMPRGGGLPPPPLPGGGMGPPPGAIPQGAPMQIAAAGQPQRWTFGASGAGRMPTVEESNGPPGQPGVVPPPDNGTGSAIPIPMPRPDAPPAPIGPPGEPPAQPWTGAMAPPGTPPDVGPEGITPSPRLSPDQVRNVLAKYMMQQRGR